MKKALLVIFLLFSFHSYGAGDKIDIPTINGHASLKIPSGLQPGQILRIKGKGFPKLGKVSRGDQLVKVQVDVPKSLSKEEKRIIKDYYEIEKDKDVKFEKFED